MNYLVSFPRSGQYLVRSLLEQVYHYHQWTFTYCDCDNRECEHGSEFRKHHDFRLDLKLREDDKCIVLYRRDWLSQLEAYFRWERRGRVGFDYRDPGLRWDASEFIRQHRPYYERFVAKWASGDHLAIDYYDLVHEPVGWLLSIVESFGLPSTMTIESIERVIAERDDPVRLKNQLTPDQRWWLLRGLGE